ncbi:hypothetical protein [Periweissella cryptocerci]|nr:hypothetical protein [Periweissella cryptocerci]
MNLSMLALQENDVAYHQLVRQVDETVVHQIPYEITNIYQIKKWQE